MRRLYPDPRDPIAVEDVYADRASPQTTDRPHVALNMVASVDGRVTRGGSASGIGSAVDRTLVHMLRVGADTLLHGAGTLRQDRLGKGVPEHLMAARVARGLRPQPLLALLTTSGDLPLERAAFADRERVVVFTAKRTPLDRRARLESRALVRIAGDERPDVATAIQILGNEFGVRSVLCEGGPTLNRSLLAGRVLDELFVTVAPKLLAGDGPTLITGPPLDPPVDLTLQTVYEHAGELYLRYTVRYV